MASSNQGGSILSFLVIGGVLAALFVGGTYLVQQRATRSSTNQAPVTVQPANQPADEVDKKTTPAADDKKVAVDTKNEEAKKDEPKATPQVTTPPSTELPKTGSAEVLSSIIGTGLLSGAIVAYMRSRRSSVTL